MAFNKTVRSAHEDKIYYLTQDELKRFFSAIPKKDLRAHAIFTFMYRFGLRISEAIILKESNIGSDGRIFIQRLKNGNSNYYKLSEEDRLLLERYVKSKEKNTEYIFSNHTEKNIAKSTIFRLYQKYAKKAGLPKDKCHPHCLRHSIAVHMLDAGLAIEDCQDWLGHRSITNTMIYARISDKRRNATSDIVSQLPLMD